MPQSNLLRQRDTLTLAKQGAPDLIATFLNYKLQSQGFFARVSKKQKHLLVLIEGEESSPDEESMLKLLKQIASKLDPAQVEKLRVCGRQKGDEMPSWLKVIQVNNNMKSEPQLKGWLESVKITPALWSGSDEEPDTKSKQGQRFLRFHLGLKDTALLPVNTVKEVLSVSGEAILAVPDTPPSVLGIHNWRGEMLWLVDLNYLLGFSPLWEIENITTNINIIVLQVENQEIGIAVRQVETIEQHDWQKLQPPEGLFPDQILFYVQGYLTQANSIILDAQSLVKAFTS